MFTVARTRSPPSQLVARTRAFMPRTAACCAASAASQRVRAPAPGTGRATGGAWRAAERQRASTRSTTAARSRAALHRPAALFASSVRMRSPSSRATRSVGLKPERAPVGRERAVALLALRVQIAEVLQDLGVAGLEPPRLLQVDVGARQIAGVEVGPAEAVDDRRPSPGDSATAACRRWMARGRSWS